MFHKDNVMLNIREGEWVSVDSTTSLALLRQGERIAHSLRLGANPVSIRADSVRVDGIAGAVLGRSTTFQIIPKFLHGDDESWIDGLNSYLNYAGRQSTFLATSRTKAAALSRFIDSTAYQFCEMLEAATRAGRPRTYSNFRATGHSPKGKINITSSVLNVVKLKPSFEWEEPTLIDDLPIAGVVRLALLVLARQCHDARVQRRVEANLSAWPVVPANLPSRLPVPSRPFAHFAPVVALAFNICLGLGRAPGPMDLGNAYVVDMVRTFERVVERALTASAKSFRTRALSVVRQDSIRFAKTLKPGSHDYHSRPDGVIYDGSAPLVVVDAKYKSFEEGADDSPSIRAANADFYQILTAAIAHKVNLGLLVYPTTQPMHDGGTMVNAWQVQLDSTNIVTIGVGTLNVVGLTPGTTSSVMHERLGSLLDELLNAGGSMP